MQLRSLALRVPKLSISHCSGKHRQIKGCQPIFLGYSSRFFQLYCLQNHKVTGVSDFFPKKNSTDRRECGQQHESPLNARKLITPGQAPAKHLSNIVLLIRFLKPVTWIPVMWSFLCGAVASGSFGWTDFTGTKFLLGILLTGPLASGTCQMLNDYFDRDLDKINEPWRPIPGGEISLRNATILIAVWSLLSIVVGYLIHPFIALYVIVGIINAHLYSANPIKLKKRLWAGNVIVAVSYLVIPWIAGEIAYNPEFTLQSLSPSLIVVFFFTVSSTGTMTINDFKSVEGDRQIGVRTLPVVFGETNAAIIAAVLIDFGQLMAAAYMLMLDQNMYALIVVLLIIPQILLQFGLVRSPKTMDVRYNAIAQNFLVAGMLVCALAIKGFKL